MKDEGHVVFAKLRDSISSWCSQSILCARIRTRSLSVVGWGKCGLEGLSGDGYRPLADDLGSDILVIDFSTSIS